MDIIWSALNDAFSIQCNSLKNCNNNDDHVKNDECRAQVEQSALRQISEMWTSIVEAFLESEKKQIMTQKKLFYIVFEKDAVDGVSFARIQWQILETKWTNRKKNPLIV